MATTTTNTLPPAFVEVFRRLAFRTKVAGGRLEPGTAEAYWDHLRRYPLDLVCQAGAVQEWHFFPTTSEWIVAIKALRQRPVAACAKCANLGLITVRYHDGAPFDVAICDCHSGQKWRAVGEFVVRAKLDLGPDNRVAYLEDFSDDDEADL